MGIKMLELLPQCGTFATFRNQKNKNKTQLQMVLDPGNIISQQNICVRRKRRRI